MNFSQMRSVMWDEELIFFGIVSAVRNFDMIKNLLSSYT